MPGYSLGHLAHHVLLRDLKSLVAQDRSTIARLIAHIAEVDARRLYADAAYSSMFDYCLRELGYSEDMAGKRITAGRAARRFPVIFDGITEGRLHLTAVCLLSKHLRGLTKAAALELIAAAEQKTNEQIRTLLAERFPQKDLAPRVRALPEQPTRCVLPSHAPERVEVQTTSGAQPPEPAHATEDMPAAPQPAPVLSVPVAPSEERPDRTRPLSPGRFGLQLTMSAETYAKWRRVEEILAPQVPRGDYAQRLDRALDAILEKYERRRFAATDTPRKAPRSKNDDHIPAAVKRAVCARDGGQCTFESASGRRCDDKGDLEFDHIIPRARGGKSTVDNLRLRCFAHNQLEAERTFGAAFMQAKRDAASCP